MRGHVSENANCVGLRGKPEIFCGGFLCRIFRETGKNNRGFAWGHLHRDNSVEVSTEAIEEVGWRCPRQGSNLRSGASAGSPDKLPIYKLLFYFFFVKKLIFKVTIFCDTA